MFPLLQRAVIKKARLDRLLDLVGKLSRQKDPRDMRFTNFDFPIDAMWIGTGITKAGNQFRALTLTW